MKKPVLFLLGLFLLSGVAFSQTPAPNRDKPTDADNTARNAANQRPDPATADQQTNNPSDLKLLQSIRQAVIAEKPLSTNGKNCKIIVKDGTVTLRGPVDSDAEKKKIAELAAGCAGAGKVTNELEVKTTAK